MAQKTINLFHKNQMKNQENKIQKITVHVPQVLLQNAVKALHKNITETVKFGLEEIIRKAAYDDLRQSRGKIKFSIDINELRGDK
jgi:hypothetical protein